MNTPTAGWQAWIEHEITRRLDRHGRAMTGAISDVLAPIQKEHTAALDELRTEVAALKREISELRAERTAPGLRAVG